MEITKNGITPMVKSAINAKAIRNKKSNLILILLRSPTRRQQFNFLLKHPDAQVYNISDIRDNKRKNTMYYIKSMIIAFYISVFPQKI